MTNPELIADTKASLGEGPVWNAETQSLLWVDIEAGQLHMHMPGGDADRIFNVGCRVGAAVPRRDGGLILATENGFEMYDLGSQKAVPFADPEEHLPNNRFNDGKCDANGRFWAGTMSMVREENAGSLYVLEPDHTVRHVLGDVTTSNGLDWSLDHSEMYYIDTPTMQVRVFEFDLASGSISNGRVAVDFPAGIGRPDGMTVDADGMLWIAHWDGGRVTRWDPRRGSLLATVNIPVDRVTSCAFGGPQFDTLFITTARHGLDDQRLADQPYAGGLFAVEPGVCGRPSNRYAG